MGTVQRLKKKKKNLAAVVFRLPCTEATEEEIAKVQGLNLEEKVSQCPNL